MKKSNLDIAFELVSKRQTPISFVELWDKVSEEQGLTEEEKSSKISKFYTALSLDGRFITLGENKWDLRKRYKFEKVHIDMNDVYVDDDMDEETDVAEDASEKELFGDEDDENFEDEDGDEESENE